MTNSIPTSPVPAPTVDLAGVGIPAGVVIAPVNAAAARATIFSIINKMPVWATYTDIGVQQGKDTIIGQQWSRVDVFGVAGRCDMNAVVVAMMNAAIALEESSENCKGKTSMMIQTGTQQIVPRNIAEAIAGQNKAPDTIKTPDNSNE